MHEDVKQTAQIDDKGRVSVDDGELGCDGSQSVHEYRGHHLDGPEQEGDQEAFSFNRVLLVLIVEVLVVHLISGL